MRIDVFQYGLCSIGFTLIFRARKFPVKYCKLVGTKQTTGVHQESGFGLGLEKCG